MSLNRLPLKLANVQVMIEPASIEQRLMRALFDNFSVVDHDDLISIADGAQPVRDHEAGAALHQTQQRLLNARFGAGIDAARRLVEDLDAGVGQHSARNRQQLALPLAEVAGSFREHGLIALR